MLDQQIDLDRVFHALADRTRRALVEKLSVQPASVKQLAAPFDMTLAAVVQHLKVLETCGLIRTTKVGRVRTCSIEPEGLKLADQWIGERRALWERRLDRLGAILAEEQDENLVRVHRRERKK